MSAIWSILRLFLKFYCETVGYEFKSVIVTFENPEDILIDIFEKLDYMSDGELVYKKEFKSLV